jgi:hypothetical protein
VQANTAELSREATDSLVKLAASDAQLLFWQHQNLHQEYQKHFYKYKELHYYETAK